MRTLVVGGEPGGGIPAVRARIEETWGASCREVLGNSDIATIIWAECEVGDGRHFIGHDLVLAELIDPRTGEHVDHAEVIGDTCTCGRTSYRLRCFGRTDDMLLVRCINVWPTAVQAGLRPPWSRRWPSAQRWLRPPSGCESAPVYWSSRSTPRCTSLSR